MKKINIHNEANINAEGKRSNKNCKPVICIETGEIFSSSADAAEKIGVHFSVMSAVCNGRIKTCKGKRYCYLNSALENLDAVMTRLREASAMEEDARKWREQEAEKEAARQAKLKHEAEVAKAREKVAKLEENCKRLESKLTEEERCLMLAKVELAALIAKEN